MQKSDSDKSATAVPNDISFFTHQQDIRREMQLFQVENLIQQ